ncbi:futalosine hydrolase [Streptomyces sp. RFCAC02]|uniref:futalosine hydrolase n=1 Tax=Streptomyces sp. RFCAC02 TaxID=2499143 RepID=UPI0019D1AD8C|nr:futalosine hydrolase [Streptomyces sp. RFCAC02]
MLRILVTTAVAAEGEAVARAGRGAPVRRPLTGGLGLARVPLCDGVELDVLAAGAGPAAAAAGTATALALGGGHGLVVSAGIAGGFAGAVPVGGTVVASDILTADFGSDTAEGFTDAAALGFGTVAHRPDPDLARAVAGATGAVVGPVLSVSTATGTAERAASLAARHRGAVAEAMEGAGVATAAALHGLPVLEIRTVSNAVGPRDRAGWRVPEALAALTRAFTAAGPALRAWAAATPHAKERDHS